MIKNYKIVLDIVSKYYGLEVNDLTGRCRTQHIKDARHAAYLLMRDQLGMSLQSIADVFNRDHSTVLKSLQKYEGGGTYTTLLCLLVKGS